MKMLKLAALVSVLALPTYTSAIGFGDVMKKAKAVKEKVDENPAIWTGYTYEEERAIGKQLAGSILGASKLVDDQELQAYVNRVGRWLATQSDRPDIDWVFGVIESDSINAFAAPGGYILLTSGLYKRLETEAQLAAVLGHEIAHITEKHHLELIRQSSLVNEGSNLAKSQAKGKAGVADDFVQNLIGNGAEIMARGLDKSSEYEADMIGMTLAAKSGYTPLGLAEVVTKLAEKPPVGDMMALLKSTHPSPEQRLEEIDEALDSKLEKRIEQPSLESRFATHMLK